VRLAPGVRLGPYEVLSVLGTGGMAEVYRARDTRLGRDVALKVVNESLAGSPDLARRFEQEARLAGSLNHPNVIAVYDVGHHQGATYFVTELLEGESLRHRLSGGPIPLHTALEWGAQMARGLAAAHARAVIHRDVKPDNVFITSDGHVKLLDFGIAKLTDRMREDGPHDLMDSTATPTGGVTGPGSVLGTPGYMSPEQVRGDSIDARTDIFSLGAVLHEMLSGQRAFPGATAVESEYAILHSEPEPLPSAVPPLVARVVLRCLEKDPARRLQSASDLAFDLELPSPTGPSGPVLRASPVLGRRAAWLVAGAGAVLAALLWFAVGYRRAPGAPLPDVEEVTLRWGAIGGARFLPDGRVVYSGAFEGRPEELFVQPSGSTTAQALGLQDVRLLAASPTGELAVLLHPTFLGGFTPTGILAQVPSVGGTPRELAEDAPYADWSPAGDLAVVRQSGASFVLDYPAGHTLFETKGWISNPRFSAKGDRIAFLHHPLAVDSLGEVVVTDLRGQTRTLSRRWATTNGLAWSPDDSEVWFTGGSYWENVVAAVSLGGSARELYRSLSRIRLEDVAKDGRVLITNLLDRLELVYVNDGGGSQTVLSWADWNDPLASLSANGEVLFSIPRTPPTSEGFQPLWVMLRKVNGGPAQVLGEGAAQDLSADGRWALVVSSDGTTLKALPTGVGQPRRIATHGLQLLRARWIPGGEDVLVSGRAPGDAHVRLYRLVGDATAPVRVSDAALSTLTLLQASADGRWAAVTDEDLRLVVISVQDGTVLVVPRLGAKVVPRGWSAGGGLWVTEGGTSPGARARLLRLDPRTGTLLEERSIGPSDPGGAIGLVDLVLTPDGRQIAFTYRRTIGSLSIARGLAR